VMVPDEIEPVPPTPPRGFDELGVPDPDVLEPEDCSACDGVIWEAVCAKTGVAAKLAPIRPNTKFLAKLDCIVVSCGNYFRKLRGYNNAKRPLQFPLVLY
jgi:hypothetical protein